MTQSVEILVMWIGVTLYAVSSVAFILGVIFSKDRWLTGGVTLAATGLVPHSIAIAARWMRVGHGPVLGFYEVVSSYAFMSVLALIVVTWRYRSLKIVGTVLMPVAFLMLGGAMLAPKGGLDITPRLASWWLVIHVAFAKLTWGSIVGAVGLGVVYLFREKMTGTAAAIAARLPRSEVVDDLIFRLTAAGFVMLGIMIAAGAIWANEAWGRYWAWDAIETWSLITWLLYGVVLHLRLTLGWTGRRFAWAVIAALPITLFAFIGVPVVYDSIHGAYLTGY